MSPSYKLQVGQRRALPCDIERDVIAHVDWDHREPLRSLGVGEEYEVPMLGQANWLVTRVS